MKKEEINKITDVLNNLGFKLSHEDKEFNLYFKGKCRIALDFYEVE